VWPHRKAAVRILAARTIAARMVADKEVQTRKVRLARNSLRSCEIQVHMK
jgi:hypothetical protein